MPALLILCAFDEPEIFLPRACGSFALSYAFRVKRERAAACSRWASSATPLPAALAKPSAGCGLRALARVKRTRGDPYGTRRARSAHREMLRCPRLGRVGWPRPEDFSRPRNGARR